VAFIKYISAYNQKIYDILILRIEIMHTTQHAKVRMKQRGLRVDDLSLVVDTAEHITPNKLFMTAAAADRAIARRKQEIQQLERLKGKLLVVDGNTIITVYHTVKKQEKSLLRRHRSHRDDA
jgi:hypothetical protein